MDAKRPRLGAIAAMGAAREHILKALSSLDPHGKDLIDVQLLRNAMAAMDASWCNEHFDSVVEAAGLERDGLVSIKGLVQWIFPEDEVPLLQRLHRLPVEVSMPLQIEPGREQPQIDAIEEGMQLEYLTDIEGNFFFFMQFVSWSQILYWDESEDNGPWGPGKLMMKDNGILVFGGDAVDKGPADIRVVKHLLHLKYTYWDRVFLVIGNRDINKLRFYAELAPGEDGSIFDKHGGAYWITNPAQYKTYEKYLEEKGLEKGHLSTLKWMLDCNMGCQNTTFKMRRRELATIGCKATDQDVLHSYRDSVDPASADPWMLDLLRVGQLAVVVGDALFVHAGLHDGSVGKMPGETYRRKSVQEWVRALNAWKDDQLKDFEARPGWREELGGPGGSRSRRRGGDELIDYGAPGGCCGISVVYFNPFENGNPHRLPETVEDFLSESKIRRVASGHQPHGESPTVVRHIRTGLIAVTCDTSYSNMGAVKVVNASNMRGDAICVARFEKETVCLEGSLSDGTKHSCTLFCGPDGDQKGELAHALVGRQLKDRSWVKTVTKDDKVLSTLGIGFTVSVQLMSVSRACMLLRPEYHNERFAVPMRDITGEMLRSKSLSNQMAPPAEPSLADLGGDLAFEMSIDADAFHKKETVIFDLHGTIWNAHDQTLERSITNARLSETLNKIIGSANRVMFATNDCNLSRVEVLRILREDYSVNVGNVPSHEELTKEREKELASRHIITAGFTCAWFLKQADVRKPFVLCSKKGFLDELHGQGINDYVATIDTETGEPKAEFMEAMNDDKVQALISKIGDDVDAIVVGWDEYFSALKVAVAAAYLKWSRDGAVKNPIRLVLCSTDINSVIGITAADFEPSLWVDRKILGLGNGPMGHSICACAGIDPSEAIDCGRPSYIFSEVIRRPEEDSGYGVNLAKSVIIGDSLSTDMELANRSDMSSVLVLSGSTSLKDLHGEEDAMRWPTWIVQSIAHIPVLTCPPCQPCENY